MGLEKLSSLTFFTFGALLEVVVLCSSTINSPDDDCSRNASTREAVTTSSVIYKAELAVGVPDTRNHTDKADGHNQWSKIKEACVKLRRLCYCENSKPVCDVQVLPMTVTPGESVTFSLISLNQDNHPVSTTLYIRFTLEDDKKQQFLNREAHIIRPGCNNITLEISSVNSKELLTLSSYPVSSSLSNLSLDVTFLSCPNGFVLLPTSPRCQCSEYFQTIHNVKCNDRDRVIEREGDSWLEYSCSGTKPALCGLKYHDSCPYHYCNRSVQLTDLTTESQNSICVGNRAGILCGGCAENYSAVIGGSDCWDCRGTSNTKTILLTLALAGLLLVTITILLDVRISSGRLNGLIFYAAIIHLNQDTFFSHNKEGFLALFFSWLNLDVGFSVCWFDGMKPIDKVWFQFAFPAYIILLVLIIAIAVKFSLMPRVSNWSAVTLPSSITLFLLAYLKILRTAVSVLPLTRVLLYPYGSEMLVWLYDANIGYFSPEHLQLFFISIIFLVLAFLYTFVLISSQFLFQLDLLDSEIGLRLSIILDAHTGRIKRISKFWFGLLLFFYTFQVAVYHFTGGDTVSNLVVAILCACTLLSFNLILDGPYSDNFTNKLEQFFFLNIIAVSALHIHFQGESKLSFIPKLLMSTALLVFIGIILERCLKYSKFESFIKQIEEFTYLDNWTSAAPNPTSESQHLVLPDMSIDSEFKWNWEYSTNSSTASNDVINTRMEFTKLFPSPNEPEDMQSTQEAVAVVPTRKNVTSSVLSIRKNDCGEANLVCDDVFVEQNAEKDKDGVNTLNIQYVKSPKQNSPNFPKPALKNSANSTKVIKHDQVGTHQIDKDSASRFTPKTVTKKYPSRIRSCNSSLTTFRRKHSLPHKNRRHRLSCTSTPTSLSSTVLASCLSPDLLTSPISVIEVTSDGKKVDYQGLSVHIPPDAIPSGLTVQIELGILAHGPFECLALTTRVSPVLWFCCKDYVRFEKDIQIVLPHCLKKVTTVGNDSLGLCFVKANYLYDIVRSVVNFRPLDPTESATFAENKGTLLTRAQHCFFCVSANQSPSLLVKKAEYCLTRIDPKPWTPHSTVYFCVSHFLKTCIEDIRKQFPSDRFEIKSMTCFQFQSDGKSSNPRISIDVTSSNGWLLAVEHPGSKEICAAEVHFSRDSDPAYKLKRECGMYPPCFQLRVCGTHAYTSSTANISFTGIVPRIDSTLVLSTTNTPLPSASFSIGPVPHGHTLLAGAPAADNTPQTYGNDTRVQSGHLKKCVSLPNRARTMQSSVYSDKFNNTISELEESEGLGYPISWPRLQECSACFATKWRQVGAYLVDQFKLDRIDYDHRNCSCETTINAVLNEWRKNGDGLPFHWSVLIAILQAVGEGDLVEKLIQQNKRDITY